MEADERVIQEVDILQLIKDIGTKNKVLQAKVLQELEKYIPPNTAEFQELRKFILDEQNSYTRSIVRLIFGDIEYLNFSKR